MLALLAAAAAPAASYYRNVQGRIIPKSDRNWTVVYEHIKVASYSGGALVCVAYTHEDVHGTDTRSDPHGKRYSGATEERVYRVKDVFVLTNYPYAGQLARGSDINPPIMMWRLGSVPVRGTYTLDSVTGTVLPGSSTGPGSHGGGHVGVGGASYSGSGLEMAIYDYGVDWDPPPPVRKAPAKSPGVTTQARAPDPADAAGNGGAPKLTDAEARALKFNQDEAAKGNSSGLYRMGMRYKNGEGVEKDLRKAYEMLKKAAEAGHPDAADELATIPVPEALPGTNSAPAGGTH